MGDTIWFSIRIFMNDSMPIIVSSSKILALIRKL